MVDRENLDKLLEMIVLQQITECDTNADWLGKASDVLRVPIEKTQQLLKDMSTEKIVIFDDELGSYMFKSIV
jgi:hypothetical protein